MVETNINAIKYIHSVHEFVNEIKLLDKALEYSSHSSESSDFKKGRLFFRGQRNAEWSVCPSVFRNDFLLEESGSLTLAHSQNSQMSFMYGFFFVKFLFFTVVCVVIVV